MNSITLESFSDSNRTKTIGDSMYRICRTDNQDMWYIFEVHNSGTVFASGKAHYNDRLEDVLSVFNNISQEREIVGR